MSPPGNGGMTVKRLGAKFSNQLINLFMNRESGYSFNPENPDLSTDSGTGEKGAKNLEKGFQSLRYLKM